MMIFRRSRFANRIHKLDPFIFSVASRSLSNSSGSNRSGTEPEENLEIQGSSNPAQQVFKTAEVIGNTTKQYTTETIKIYADIEKNLMQRINESNTRRFRIGLIGSILAIIWIGAVFGEKIRKKLAKETAGVAKEALENESLKTQTQELAMAVVQTVLNDKDVTAHAAQFLREASSVPETQQALLELTLHVLQHPDSLRELNILVKKLIQQLTVDKDTIDQTAALFGSALQHPVLVAAIGKLIADLTVDPELVKVVSTFLVTIAAQPEVAEAIKTLLQSSAQTVLQDDKIISQSKEFVADVMGDDTLQKEGGDALWKSVAHALKPGVVRIAGFTLVLASIGLAKILLSPF